MLLTNTRNYIIMFSSEKILEQNACFMLWKILTGISELIKIRYYKHKFCINY